MALGSVSKLGMNGEEAWNATQAGWSLVWITLSLLGVAGIYTAAQNAGLIK